MTISEKHFDNWGEFKIFIDHSLPQWIYRGQSSAQWDLSSSLERSNLFSGVENPYSLETQIIEEFQRVVNHYLPTQLIPKNTLEWLALIQHYGTPTRLIDFTKSPYIAAYFAFESEQQIDENVCIWIIDRIHFYQRSIYYISTMISELAALTNGLSSSLYTFSGAQFESLFSQEGLDCVVPVEPFYMNERYYLQQSIFLSQCNPEKRFQDQLDFLKDSHSSSIKKVTMPFSIRNEVIRDLNKMNIKRSSLFPGLDGFAKTLNLEYSTLAKLQDHAKSISYLKSNEII
jgi:hypothetical protein